MKNAFVFFAILITAFILESSFFPKFFISLADVIHLPFFAGHTIQVSLIVVVYLALHRDVSGTLIWSIFFGLAASWFGLAWKGALATGFIVVAVLGWLLKNSIMIKDELTISIFVGSMALIESIVHLIAGHMLNQVASPFEGRLGFVLVQVVLTALASPPAFRILKLCDRLTGVESVSRRYSLLLE